MAGVTGMKKIGVFGGSFDPVHMGHIGLARDSMVQAGLEKVVFVPVKRQPFKLEKQVTSGEDRVNMLTLALDNMDGMEVSRYELDASGISYTYLTLRAIRKQYGADTKLYFITGTDSFLQIQRWKHAGELLTAYCFIVGTRPGYKAEELKVCMEQVRQEYNTEVINIDNTQLDVSSTEIRRRIEAGIPAKDLIPAAVERYIIEHGLYR